MLFDCFISFFVEMTPEVPKFLMVYKAFGTTFPVDAKACVANAFSCFPMSPKHIKIQ